MKSDPTALLALLLLGASLAGCLGEEPRAPLDPTGWEGCTEGENLTEEACDTGATGETNNTSAPEPAPPASNITVGTWEGEMLPNITDQARQLNGVWEDWTLQSMLDSAWNGTPNGTENGTDHRWLFIEFASTDCGHCWNAADDLSLLHENYSAQVAFLTFAVNFSSNNNFNASLDEIAAFQDGTTHSGCMQNTRDCAERPGPPHNWTYVDDRDQTWMYTFHAQGTPMFVIVAPDGIVAWHQYQHTSDSEEPESVTEALERFFGPTA